MGPIGLVVRTRLRRRAAAAFVVVAMTAVVVASVLAAVAGARRTDAALPAFERSTHIADGFAIFTPQIFDAPTSVDMAKETETIRRLPGVTEASALSNALVQTTIKGDPLRQRTLLAWIGYDAKGIESVGRPRIVDGRLADDRAVDEITVDEELARDARLAVGDRFDVRAFRTPQIFNVFDPNERPAGLRITARVVGIVRQPTDVRDLLTPVNSKDNIYEGHYDLYLTSAFWERAGHDVAGYNPAVAFRSEHPSATITEIQKRFGRAGLQDAVDADDFRAGVSAITAIQRSVSLQSRAMQAFAVATAVAGLALVIQTLGRHLALDVADDDPLRGVGLSGRQLGIAGLLQATALIVVGTTVGVVLAWGASAFLPLSGTAADRSLPDRGVHFDAAVLLGGGAVLAMMLVAGSLVPMWWRRRKAAAPITKSFGGRLASRLGPTAASGVRFALEPGRGRSAVPVRSALVTGTVAVTAALAATVFSWSLADARTTPARYGVNWDVSVGGYADPGEAAAGLKQLEAVDGVGPIAGINTNSFDVNGQSLILAVVRQERGTVDPVIVEGRPPTRAGELALGGEALRRLHLHVGDDAKLEGQRVTVVGRAVVNAAGIETALSPGFGGVIDWAELPLITPDAGDQAPQVYLTRFAPGADHAKVMRQLRRQFPNTVATAIEPADIVNLSDVARLPGYLAVMLGVLGLGTMVHALVSVVRRRRHELAVLKSVGFGGPQLRRAVVIQGATMSSICVLIGFPLGIAAGRIAWGTAATQLSIVVHPVIELGPVALGLTVFVVVAMIVALVPGIRASRVPAAAVLRTD